MDVPQSLIEEENRKIRLLRISTDILTQVLMTQPLTAGQADRLIMGMREFAAHLFPGKRETFDLIYLPRFRRALAERAASAPKPATGLANEPDCCE